MLFIQHLLPNLIISNNEITVFYFRLCSAVGRTHPTAFLLLIFILLFCGCALKEWKEEWDPEYI